MDERTKEQRIVEARMKLRERFLARMQGTPGVADPRPQGAGPPNRHGMPQVPVGQTVTERWPVLDLGRRPGITRETWSLVVDGACRNRLKLTFDDLMALEQVDDTSDFHCVTTWSKLDVPWRGVRIAEVAALAEPHNDARFILCQSFDGYSTNLPLEEALKADVLLAHTVQGEPLPDDHGGPVRVITPQLYAWKGAKWIQRITFLVRDQPGYWEVRGYSNTAHPWRDDRYG